jgi:KRAB domain-containing zinc finger protein
MLAECDVCHKMFISKSKLRDHYTVHTGLKRFQCDLCAKTFRFNGQLKIHKKVHLGEKNYVCDVCQKSYYKSNDLTRHKITHTGEKPFQVKEASGKIDPPVIPNVVDPDPHGSASFW